MAFEVMVLGSISGGRVAHDTILVSSLPHGYHREAERGKRQKARARQRASCSRKNVGLGLISYWRTDPAGRRWSVGSLDRVYSASGWVGRACFPAAVDSADFAVP